MTQAAENFVVVLIGGGGSSHGGMYPSKAPLLSSCALTPPSYCGMYPSKDPRIKLSSSTICDRYGEKSGGRYQCSEVSILHRSRTCKYLVFPR
jgi:hypothetical protein